MMTRTRTYTRARWQIEKISPSPHMHAHQQANTHASQACLKLDEYSRRKEGGHHVFTQITVDPPPHHRPHFRSGRSLFSPSLLSAEWSCGRDNQIKMTVMHLLTKLMLLLLGAGWRECPPTPSLTTTTQPILIIKIITIIPQLGSE